MFDFRKANLPEIYKRNNQKCYLDPIRKKLIYITPEETVRQKVVAYLKDKLKVPAELIVVEQHLSHYGIKSRKRADIVVEAYENEDLIVPIAVVECKAPNVRLDFKAKKQAIEYTELIGARYAVLTNEWSTYCFCYDDIRQQYVQIEKLPSYKGMLEGKYMEVEKEELPSRPPFEEMYDFLENYFAKLSEFDYGDAICKMTPMDIAFPLFNLWGCLVIDDCVQIPPGDYGLFELIRDLGVRKLTYGNASGGKYHGDYRSFLVKIGRNTEIFSLSTSQYGGKGTIICVAHDDGKKAHHALQLVVDENVVIEDNKVSFYHNGRIAIGNMGSGKIDELRKFVAKRFPKIIFGDKFYLGSIINDRLWRLDDPEVIEVIVNLISYAIVRDEYREFVVKKKRKR